jgi:Icc-related predicted phosphoesterase
MIMKIAILGDIHSHFDLLHEFIRTHPYVEAVVQVGDLGAYYSEEAANQANDLKRFGDVIRKTIKSKKAFKVPVYFCKGNNEDFNFLENRCLERLNIHYVPNGHVVNLGDSNIGFIGGVFSPNKFDRSPKSLMGRQKRFFVKEEVEALENYHSPIDILVSHIGAAKWLPDHLKGGIHKLSDLVVKVKPKWYIHGHHHYNYYDEEDEIKIQGLGLFPRSDKSYKILEV